MKNLVVLTGAGISAESGLQTFRDSNGLWEGHRIEDVATPDAWKKNPQRVLDFYNIRRRNVMDAMPNAAHTGLKELEKHFKVNIITQNVDDLHERAGSTNVLHLHGELLKMRSEKNDSLVYDIREDIQLGQKAADGAQLRPHIVWFNEPVPLFEEAVEMVRKADIFVIIGTSLVVYPAASLMHYTRPEIPAFILDKNIPSMNLGAAFTTIEKPAAEGMAVLHQMLMRIK